MVTAESTTIDAEYIDLPLGDGDSIKAVETLDDYDPEKFRFDQSALHRGAVKKLLNTVPVRKPGKQDFIRVHLDPAYRLVVALLEKEGDGIDTEKFLVLPHVADQLTSADGLHKALLYTTITRQKVLFLWKVNLSLDGSRTNDWQESAVDAANTAVKQWIRVAADMSLRAYVTYTATTSFEEPEWPEKSFSELLKIAFKKRIIDSVDHEVIQKIRGDIA